MYILDGDREGSIAVDKHTHIEAHIEGKII